MPVIDAYDKLVLNFDGADGSKTFTDSSLTPKNVTAYGTAQIDTAQYKFNGSSGWFDGNSDYLTVPDSDDWYFGTGDLTIVFWFRITSLPGTGLPTYFLSQGATDTDRWLFVLANTSDLYYLRFLSTISGVNITSDFQLSISINTWYHVALTKDGTNTRCFLNGIQIGSTSTNAHNIPNLPAVLTIGRRYIASGTYYHYFPGWLDAMRISKGIARWTSNFTPPDEAYYRGIPAAYDSGRRNRLNIRGVSSYNQLA